MVVEIVEIKDAYKEFYEQYGMCLKFGMKDDSTIRYTIAELLRYSTTKSGDEQISLKEYVNRMKEGQNDIYQAFKAGAKFEIWQPFLEQSRKKGHEVIYMPDLIDAYVVQAMNGYVLREFKGKKLQRVTR